MISVELLLQLKLASLEHAKADLVLAKELYAWLSETALDRELMRRVDQLQQQEAAKLAV